MKRTILTIILSIWIILILFLSFQTGTDTARTSMGLTEYILQFFGQGDIPYEMIQHWHMIFRLCAHPVLFCVYGMLAIGVAATFIKRDVIAFLIASLSGIALAIWSEVGKKEIPGRHCDIEEMMLNIVGVMIGTILILLLQIVINLIKRRVVLHSNVR